MYKDYYMRIIKYTQSDFVRMNLLYSVRNFYFIQIDIFRKHNEKIWYEKENAFIDK